MDLRAKPMVDYEGVAALRPPVLHHLHRPFLEQEMAGERRRANAYWASVHEEDPQLTQFATYMMLSEREGPDARTWPEPLRDANGETVARLRTEHATRVDYHRWLQFELDRQLGSAAQSAVKAGLALRMYQDLAVGSAASGRGGLGDPQLFLQGATPGAPPDMYFDEGT